MKLDVLDGFEKVKICKNYNYKGQVIDYVPMDLENVEPIYEELPGWDNTKDAKSFDDLPQNAKNFILRIEELTGIRVEYISIGPDRIETIIR